MLLLTLLVACAGPAWEVAEREPVEPAADESDVIDLRKEFPPAPPGGIEIRTPDFEIPPYSETLHCYYGTYEGPTVGATFMQPLQADQYSHHNQLKAVPDDEDWPNGTLIDCEDGGDMSRYVPLFEAVGIEVNQETADDNWLDLPDGVAMKFENGQKWVLDIHYINPTDKTLLVNNGVNIDYIPEDEVTAWAGSIQFDAGPPDIPPGETVEARFTCPFSQDWNILSMLGHMHARGTYYGVDYLAEDGSETQVYEVAEWDGGYHPYYPHLENWAPGTFSVKEGEELRTTCEWTNYTDIHLGFPEEMCTTVLVVYPLESPLICIDGEYRDLGEGGAPGGGGEDGGGEDDGGTGGGAAPAP
jgi:hypothetical protein